MRAGLLVVALAGMLAFACNERYPKRDYMAAIKGEFNRLQIALRDRNRAALDSLASRDMIDEGMSIDSLVRFVSGPSHQRAFERFGKYEIMYNDKKARIDCSLVDSAGQNYLPVTLTFVREKDDWRLKRFEPGRPPMDTL
jgi:hypothetical protein